MSIQADLKKIEVVPSGEYEAVLVDVGSAEGPRGPLWIWHFEITSGEHAGVEVSGISSTNYSTFPSKSYKWAMTLGHPSDVGFDTNLIEGHPCRVKLEVYEKNDETGNSLGDRNKLGEILVPTKSQLELEGGTRVPDQQAAPSLATAPDQADLPADPVGDPPVGEQLSMQP